jgi:hypothetical protein
VTRITQRNVLKDNHMTITRQEKERIRLKMEEIDVQRNKRTTRQKALEKEYETALLIAEKEKLTCETFIKRLEPSDASLPHFQYPT